MSDEEAAGFRIGYSTAWIGLVRRGGLREGERLLVLGGAGGSGAAAIGLGRGLGAEVIAVAAGSDKASFCRELGAHTVIDRTAHDVATAVLDATGGAGVDVVYDPVGGEPANTTVSCLAPGGRLLAIGFASGTWVRPDVGELVRRNASLVGVYAGGLSRAENVADHEALLALHDAGHLGGTTTAVPFHALPEALGTVDAGEAVGKLVLRGHEPG